MQSRCLDDGRLQARIGLVNSDHSGELVTLDVDGTLHDLTIVGRRAVLTIAGQQGTGDRTVELVEPGGCIAAQVVTCE